MENRRPPRNYSPRQRPFSERSRQPVSNKSEHNHRGDGANAQQNRPARRPGNDRFQPRAQSAGYNRQDRDDRYFRGPNNQERRPGKFGYKQSPNQRRGKPAPHKDEPPKIKITSDLQITDGKHHGKTLQNSVSPKAAVTSRKLREIMFKVVSRRVRAGRFLDLGAGAGTMGIEAISRGAMASTFVDRSLKMCSFVRKNLESLGIKNGHGEVVELEILPFLKQMAARKRSWDLVYFGTRDAESMDEAVNYLGRGIPIAAGGLLLIEHSSEREFPEKLGSLKRWRTIRHDGSTVTFYERK
jgi:16S rRNA (guanine966-N2)-methyltransferase